MIRSNNIINMEDGGQVVNHLEGHAVQTKWTV